MRTAPRRLLLGGVLAGCSLVFACSYESLTAEETDVVLTIPDEGRDYSRLKTYALPDEVVDLCDVLGEEGTDPEEGSVGGAGGVGSRLPEGALDDCFNVDHSLDEVVLDRLAENMDDLGYRRVDDVEEETPDVVLLAGYVAQDNYSMGTAYWCWPYAYYYGCWYTSYAYAYNLPTGALIVDMVVVDESMGGELSSAWTMAAQGLFVETDVPVGQRFERAIDQAFTQSPYLDDGGEE